jgi:hypothetical protein
MDFGIRFLTGGLTHALPLMSMVENKDSGSFSLHRVFIAT